MSLAKRVTGPCLAAVLWLVPPALSAAESRSMSPSRGQPWNGGAARVWSVFFCSLLQGWRCCRAFLVGLALGSSWWGSWDCEERGLRRCSSSSLGAASKSSLGSGNPVRAVV